MVPGSFNAISKNMCRVIHVIGSYIRAHALVILYNSLRESDKMLDKPTILSFPQLHEFVK